MNQDPEVWALLLALPADVAAFEDVRAYLALRACAAAPPNQARVVDMIYRDRRRRFIAPRLAGSLVDLHLVDEHFAPRPPLDCARRLDVERGYRRYLHMLRDAQARPDVSSEANTLVRRLYFDGAIERTPPLIMYAQRGQAEDFLRLHPPETVFAVARWATLTYPHRDHLRRETRRVEYFVHHYSDLVRGWADEQARLYLDRSRSYGRHRDQ